MEGRMQATAEHKAKYARLRTFQASTNLITLWNFKRILAETREEAQQEKKKKQKEIHWLV